MLQERGKANEREVFAKIINKPLAACRTIWAEVKIWSFEIRFWLI